MSSDPRIPPSSDCVLRYLLDKRAAALPDKTFVIFEDGTEWSYAELRSKVRSTAEALQSLGVKQGDHILVWLPNGLSCLKVWFAINYL